MSTDLPDQFRQLLKFNIELSRQAFDSLMAIWATPQAASPPAGALQPLGEKILEAFRDNVAANFAFALRLIASKDARETSRLYAEHVQERMQSFSRQFQEISFAGLIGGAIKANQFGDISRANKAANKAYFPVLPTVPLALHSHEATPQSSDQRANGLLNSEAASITSSNPSHVAKRDAKSKKPRKLQRPAAGKRSKQRKRRP